MGKKLTSWKKQGQTGGNVNYDANTIGYDDSNTLYGGNLQSADSVIKPRSIFRRVAKVATAFKKNAAAFVNAYLYNSTKTYNGTHTYNGGVTGEAVSTAKKPTDWSKE